ncbi:tubulin beta-4B chain-like [Lepidochelys kempii]|uniref:tubulin beta-4B chain-like n=1 Tax=Lepidochelys kempii TaxID=8472 RepID=UPI003C702B88
MTQEARALRAMSAVWLHVGQCGNQIGEEWWQILTSEKVPHAEADRYPFCSPDGKLSAICVDSEPKVVRKLQKRVRRGSFRETNLIVGKRGRGNNWAYGYHGLHSASEKNLLERTMESLRKEVERRDCYCGTVLFHSLGGGTGAGVGTVFWDSLASSVVHSLPRASHAGRPHYSTSVLAVAHSYQEDTFLLSRDSVLRKLKQAYRCVSWNPFPLSCWTASLNIVEPGCQSHSLTVCANHSSSAELLQQVVARAEAMYKTNACLHWYWRYGCEEEDFQQAFETLCSVADDYSRLGE